MKNANRSWKLACIKPPMIRFAKPVSLPAIGTEVVCFYYEWPDRMLGKDVRTRRTVINNPPAVRLARLAYILAGETR